MVSHSQPDRAICQNFQFVFHTYVRLSITSRSSSKYHRASRRNASRVTDIIGVSSTVTYESFPLLPNAQAFTSSTQPGVTCSLHLQPPPRPSTPGMARCYQHASSTEPLQELRESASCASSPVLPAVMSFSAFSPACTEVTESRLISAEEE